VIAGQLWPLEPWEGMPSACSVGYVISIAAPHKNILIAQIEASRLTPEERIATAQRILDCVNAMAGMKNPAAVKGLIDAVRHGVSSKNDHDSIQGIYAALTAMECEGL